MPNAKIKELQSTVNKLQAERQGHVDAIAEIDAAFKKLGIAPGALKKRRGRRPGRKARRPAKRKKVGRKPKRRTGKRYAVSGTDSILRFVKQAGAKGTTGGQIDKHWKSQGRAGSAYNILGQLVKAKKIKRRRLKGKRGSAYTA